MIKTKTRLSDRLVGSGALLLLMFFLVALLFVPFAIIFALNTLFPVLAIPYTFWTWLSVVILNLTWAGKFVTAKIKE